MPSRTPIGRALRAAFAGVFVVLAAAGARAGDDLASMRTRLQRDSTRAVRCIDRGQPDSAIAIARAGAAAFTGVADRAFAARASMLEPGILIRLARAKEALPGVLASERLAAAARDTSVWVLALRIEAMARNYLGDYARAAALARRWDALAAASGNDEYRAFAATMRGWFAWRRADLVSARHELEWALPVFERFPESSGLPYTLNVLAGVLSAQGEYARSGELYRRMLAVSAVTGSVPVRLMALENLARVESRTGDPMRALSRWREALQLRRARHETGDWLVTADNVVEELLALGRADEAAPLAEEAVATAERESLGLELGWQRAMLGNVRYAQGRPARAKVLWRSVLAGRRPEDAQPRALAAAGLVEALAAEDSSEAALALATAECPAPGSGAEQEVIARLVSLRARLLTDAGRPADAAALARPVAERTEASGDLEWALAAWTQVVRAERRVGHGAAAAAAVDHATGLWERSRAHVSGLEYREVRGEQAHALMLEAIAGALAGPGDTASRAAAAFAVAQRFKTRTLLEHVAEPGASGAAAPAWLEAPLVDLARFQRDVLAPDELFLELAAGADTTYIFAVTREECRVLRAPGTRGLAPALAVLAQPPAPGRGASGDPYALAGARVGAQLLAGVGDSALARHPALLVAADGAFHRSPPGAWIPPGAHAPLVETHRISLVPSASVLTLLRGRRPAAGGRLLALAGAQGRGRVVLTGARHEVADLAARYRGVDARYAGDGVPSMPELAAYRAIHFAGHARVDEQLPWRSGLLVGAGAEGEDSLLTAGRIAAGRLAARLVVLSSCRSGGGRVREGEGVAGLASAFLAAGSGAVVASLWAVEDRATERLMRHFYEGLARGWTADRALGAAQAALRADPRTADPFCWAGFVLVGDGRTTLPLARRPLPIPPPWAAVAVVTAAAALAAVAVGRRGRARRR